MMLSLLCAWPALLALAWAAFGTVQEAPPAVDPILRRAREIVAEHAASRVEPPRSVDVESYRLALSVDLESRSIEGRMRVRLRPFGVPRPQISLHAEDLEIRSVRDAEGTVLEFRHEGSSLHVELGRVVSPKQVVELDIVYRARPRRGLFFVASDPSRPDQVDQVWSQGQSEMSRAWFPCRDAPDDRALFSLEVEVDEDLRTFSNGRRVESTTADGRRTDRWQLDVPIPVHLANLVIGHFEDVDLGRLRDIPLVAHARPELAGRAAGALAHTGDALAWFERSFGTPYPYPVYRQVLVAEYPYGGMENASCTTLDERRLPADGEPSPRLDALMVHELAHQWWGDAISCGSWSDLWLNEGFVSYAEVLYLQHRHGPDTAALHFLTMREEATTTLREALRPVICTHFDAPDDLFDAHVYDAGAVFLHLLRGVMGDAAFFEALRRWTARGIDRTVVTTDLQACFQEGLERDLAPLFDQWLRAPGRPELHCRWEWDEGDEVLVVHVQQRQEGEGVPEVYAFPLDISFAVGDGLRRARLEIDERRERLRVACPQRPDFVRFDHDGWVSARFEITQSPAQWIAQLDGAGDALGRAQAAAALVELLREPDRGGSGAEAALSAVVRAQIHDPSVVVRMVATQALAGLERPVVRTALATSLHDDDARVRRASAEGLGMCELDPMAVEALLDALPLEDDPEVEAAVIDALSRLGFEQMGPLLQQILEDARIGEAGRAAALVGLARVAPAEAETEALRRVRPGSEPVLREAAIEALGLLLPGSAAAADRLLELLADPSPRVRYDAAAALESLEDPARLADLVRAHDRSVFDDLKTTLAGRIAALLPAELPDEAPAAAEAGAGTAGSGGGG